MRNKCHRKKKTFYYFNLEKRGNVNVHSLRIIKISFRLFLSPSFSPGWVPLIAALAPRRGTETAVEKVEPNRTSLYLSLSYHYLRHRYFHFKTHICYMIKSNSNCNSTWRDPHEPVGHTEPPCFWGCSGEILAGHAEAETPTETEGISLG